MGSITIRILVVLLFLSSACTPVNVDMAVHTETGKNDGLPPLRCNSNKLSLEVISNPQQTNNWCWAASAEVVVKYHGIHNDFEQCKFVTKSREDQVLSGSNDPEFCCKEETSIPAEKKDTYKALCRSGGWPTEVFAKSSPPLSSSQTGKNQVLTWDALRHQLCEMGPFIYSIRWLHGGKHTGVASGYRTTQVQGFERFVDVDEHGAAGFATIPYQTWVRDPGTHTHYRDIINIKPSL